MRKRPAVVAALVALAALAASMGLAGASSGAAAAQGQAVRPLISDWQYLGSSATPPSQAACNAVGRRCFNPTSMANSYNYAVLHAAGNMGQGKTIAIVDSFGEENIKSDLQTFDRAFGLPDPPSFKILCVQGCPSPTPPPPNNGTGLEYHNLWDLEVALDVEWAHATAPLANILLVTTPTAETLGVQGFQQMMNAEDYVITNHLADVISQSFGSGEGAFNNGLAVLNQLRHALIDAKANNISVFASSGDGGTTNGMKQSLLGPQGTGAGPNQLIPYQSVIWPGSDPLVTAVGGTYLCTNAVTGLTVDSVSPPVNCQSAPGVREPGWVASGGGYSIFFSRPEYQNVLPPGSTFVGSTPGAPGPNTNMRGIPDIAYQASARTGVLVYMTEPNTTTSGVGCGGANPCSTGWFVVGGTSSGSPQWAGIAALADQMAGRDLGFLNPALYAIANNPAKYAADFYDVTIGNNGCCGEPGYNASTGWDAVTGLGTPNVANLIPDLIAATR
jgi:subtilase family serine protease